MATLRASRIGYRTPLVLSSLAALVGPDGRFAPAVAFAVVLFLRKHTADSDERSWSAPEITALLTHTTQRRARA